MESQPQNPEFRNNPENFHPCAHIHEIWVWMTAQTKIINSTVVYREHFSISIGFFSFLTPNFMPLLP